MAIEAERVLALRPGGEPRVFLVADDRSTRDAARAVLDRAGAIVEAIWREEDVRASGWEDIVVVDLALRSVDAVSLIRKRHAATRPVPIIALSDEADATRVLAALRAGASGCLLKSDIPTRLVGAISEGLLGGTPLSPVIGQLVLGHLRRPIRASSTTRPAAKALTKGERAALEQLARGLTYDDVATVLGISVNTVRTHVRALYEKLDVGSRTEAVTVAMRLGIVSHTPFPKAPQRRP